MKAEQNSPPTKTITRHGRVVEVAVDNRPQVNTVSWPTLVGFIAIHLACFAAIWTGVTAEALIICAVLYVLRVFGITGGFHRYFAHRGYSTSRVFQFIMAWFGQMSLQRGVLWWAAKHREHHRDSDLPSDAHSPRQHGFWVAHVGWIFTPAKREADMGMLKDFTKYPELVWLNERKYLPGVLTAIACYLIGGWPGLIVGFFWSTVLVYHATFTINSLSHVFGKQRYLTGDDSRNNWLLAIISLGEGWHNNHHYYPGSARNGFFWYEFDITYYFLKILSWFGIVWDLRQPPETVLRNEKQVSNAILDKVAVHIASGVQTDAIATRIKSRWAEQGKKVEDLRAYARRMMDDAEARLPELPSFDELRSSARRMFANTPSLDEAVERAQAMIQAAVSKQLLDDGFLRQPA